ncbi:unnamed protein product [Gongylonema pulchrum]|uniref:Kinesin motor domain-containing protein n=1 Tax=Gongylonema pulchrum TaxID=637853 RepID=A0A183DQG5_9BILA|nr:unnamed protein product [Gongylonema pulchrum]
MTECRNPVTTTDAVQQSAQQSEEFMGIAPLEVARKRTGSRAGPGPCAPGYNVLRQSRLGTVARIHLAPVSRLDRITDD